MFVRGPPELSGSEVEKGGEFGDLRGLGGLWEGGAQTGVAFHR